MPRQIESIPVETTRVVCAGDEGLAHPRVFLVTSAQGFVDCPYCGRRFVLKECAGKDSKA